MTVPQTLDAMPVLPRLYARAVRQALRSRGRRRARGDEPASRWSTGRLRVNGVLVAEDRLATYRRVCGFAAGDTVPLTYPQMLAFPLQLQLMTSPAFPFPAIGTVHLANTVEQYEPVTPGAVLALTVHATDLRPHRRGRQLTVVTEAQVSDREVWRARSEYLRVERPDPRTDPGPERPAADGATTLGLPVTWELAADVGRRYAAVSGDRNPIHLYDVTARPFGFRHHIAHGMWTVARCLAELDADAMAEMRCEVRFRQPVPLPGRVEFTAAAEDGRSDFSVGSSGAPDRHLRGSLVKL